MFDGLLYWLGARGCSLIGIVSELMSSQGTCDRHQTWNMGAVVLGTALLFVAYLIMRRRR